jgi:hypothetical protein
VLKNADRLTMLATLRGGVKQAIRNHVASIIFGIKTVHENMANEMTELSIGYPKSPLNMQGAKLESGPRAGQRAPIRPPEMCIGSGSSPRFALFAETDDNAKELLAKYPKLLETVVRAPFEGGGLWLVRPDGYVALATAKGDWESVRKFLNGLEEDAV